MTDKSSTKCQHGGCPDHTCLVATAAEPDGQASACKAEESGSTPEAASRSTITARTDPLHEAIALRHRIYYGLPSMPKGEIDKLINEQGGHLARADQERQALWVVVAAARHLKDVALNFYSGSDRPDLSAACDRSYEALAALDQLLPQDCNDPDG